MVAQFFPASTHRFAHKYQSLDFVWQRDAAGESLYLIGFENTSEAQPNPLDPGKNVAYLFDVDSRPPAELPPVPALPRHCRRLSSSFATNGSSRPAATGATWTPGACAYVDSNQQLIVYSVFHFLAKIGGGGGDDPVFKCLEFRATDFSTVALIEDGWVDLYEQSGLVGRRLAILGPWTAVDPGHQPRLRRRPAVHGHPLDPLPASGRHLVRALSADGLHREHRRWCYRARAE